MNMFSVLRLEAEGLKKTWCWLLSLFGKKEFSFESLCFSYDGKTDKISMSYTKFKTKDLKLLGRLFLFIFKTFYIIDVKETMEDGESYTQINNLTLINLVLKFFGPMNEQNAVIIILLLQVSYFVLHGTSLKLSVSIVDISKWSSYKCVWFLIIFLFLMTPSGA